MITYSDQTQFKIPKMCLCCCTQDVSTMRKFTGTNSSQYLRPIDHSKIIETYSCSLDFYICSRCQNLRTRYNRIDGLISFIRGVSIFQLIILIVCFLLWLLAFFINGSFTFPLIFFLTTSFSFLTYYTIKKNRNKILERGLDSDDLALLKIARNPVIIDPSNRHLRTASLFFFNPHYRKVFNSLNNPGWKEDETDNDFSYLLDLLSRN